MIDSLATWYTTFLALPKVGDGSWSTNISNWVNDRVTAKAQVTNVNHNISPFTFDKATFKTQLDLLVDTLDRNAGSMQFAHAWRVAIDSSALITLPGDSISSGTPAETWLSVASSIIDVSSRDSAESTLAFDLSDIPLVIDPYQSDFPIVMRNAFLNLTVSITGINQLSNPLSILGSPLI